jgi:hypothetical protein
MREQAHTGSVGRYVWKRRFGATQEPKQGRRRGGKLRGTDLDHFVTEDIRTSTNTVKALRMR